MGKQDKLKQQLESFVQKPVKTAEPTPKAEPVKEPTGSPTPKAKRPVGRPKVYYGGIERTSITLEPEMIRDVIEEALQEYLTKYESEHGTIRVPATYRDK